MVRLTWLLLALLVVAAPARAERLFIYGFESFHDPTTDSANNLFQDLVFDYVVGSPTIVLDSMASTLDNNFALELNPLASVAEYVGVEIPEGNVVAVHVTMKIVDNPRVGNTGFRRIVAEGRRDVQTTAISQDEFNTGSDVRLDLHDDQGLHIPSDMVWDKVRGIENDTTRVDADATDPTLRVEDISGDADAVTCGASGSSTGDGSLYVTTETPPHADSYIEATMKTHSTDDDPQWLCVRCEAENGYFLKVQHNLDAGDDGDDMELWSLASDTWTQIDNGTELFDALVDGTDHDDVIRLSVEGDQVWVTVGGALISKKFTNSVHTAVRNAGIGLGNLGGAGSSTGDDCGGTSEIDNVVVSSIEPDEPTFLLTYNTIFQGASISPGQYELFWANRNDECFFSKYNDTDCSASGDTDCIDASIFGDQYCSDAVFGRSVPDDLGTVSQLWITLESGVALDATRPHDVRLSLWVDGRQRGRSIRRQGICSGLAADEVVARACGADGDCDQTAPADTCSSTNVNKTGRILFGGTEDTIAAGMTIRIDDIVIANDLDEAMAFLRLQDLSITGTCDPRDWSHRGSMTAGDHGAWLNLLGGNQTVASDGDTAWMESSGSGIVDDLCELTNITLSDGHACSGSPLKCQSGLNNNQPCVNAIDCDETIDPNAGFAVIVIVKKDTNSATSGIQVAIKDGTSGGVTGPIFLDTEFQKLATDVWEAWYAGTWVRDGDGNKWDSGGSPETQFNNVRIELNSTKSLANAGISEAYGIAEISMPRLPIINHLSDQNGDGEIKLVVWTDSRGAPWASNGAILGAVEQLTALDVCAGPASPEQFSADPDAEPFLRSLRGQTFSSPYTTETHCKTITGSATAKADYVIIMISADHLLHGRSGSAVPVGWRGYCWMEDATDPAHGQHCAGDPAGSPPTDPNEESLFWLTRSYCVRGDEFGDRCYIADNVDCTQPYTLDPNSCIDGVTDPNRQWWCMPGTLNDPDCPAGVCHQPPSLAWSVNITNQMIDWANDANTVPIVVASSFTKEFDTGIISDHKDPRLARRITCSRTSNAGNPANPHNLIEDRAKAHSLAIWNLAESRGENRIHIGWERERRCGSGHQGCYRDFVHECTSRRSDCAEENWPAGTDTIAEYLAAGLGNCCWHNPTGDDPLPLEIDLDIIAACMKGDSATGGDDLFVNQECQVEVENP